MEHAAGHLWVWHAAQLHDGGEGRVPGDGGGHGHHQRHQDRRSVGVLRPVQHAVHCRSGKGNQRYVIMFWIYLYICIFIPISFYSSRIRNFKSEHMILYFVGLSCLYSGLKIGSIKKLKSKRNHVTKDNFSSFCKPLCYFPLAVFHVSL